MNQAFIGLLVRDPGSCGFGEAWAASGGIRAEILC